MADPLSSIEVVVAPEATPLPDGGISPQAAPVPEPISIANQEPTPPPGPSLLAKILAYNEGRKPRLIRLKLKRMAHDPFAFFRGSNHLYAEAWPDLRPPDPGPGIVLCGDLHLENFGAYVDDEGELLYDINDFDEAIVGPCSLDLVRCATSILLASELWRLTPLQASGMVLGFLDRYRATVTGADAREPIDPRVPRLERGPIWEILGDRALVRRADLIDQNTERRKGSRRIVRRKNSHPALKADAAEQVRAAVESYGAATGRADFFMPLDVTGRVAGIGSLGLERYLILVAGPGAPKPKRLFDLKQATPSALGPHASRPWPFPDADDASRVIRAERLLQARPTAGLDVVTIGETAFRLREMIPSENLSSLARLNKKPDKLRTAIQEAGLLTGLAHLRGARSLPDSPGSADALAKWAAGPALDSVLAAAGRFADRTRRSHRQFRAELRSRGAYEVIESLGKWRRP
jgi:uncharacterized protein (DUF2252 family)